MLGSLVLAAVLGSSSGVLVQAASECDFSRFKPTRCDGCLEGQEPKRVQPEYPMMARQAGVEGDVVLDVLVDRQGKVVRTCTREGHPLLRGAAEKAILKWQFPRNFGLKSRPKERYILGQVTFRFRKNGVSTAEQPN
jgi:TonB family protein